LRQLQGLRDFGKSAAAAARIIDLHVKPRASLETKHPSQRSDDITTTRFLGFLEGSPPQLINNSPIFFSSRFFTLSSLTCHESLLCFALASESCFYLFGIWERFRWPALQASFMKGAF
jgi:hypothetical protein